MDRALQHLVAASLKELPGPVGQKEQVITLPSFIKEPLIHLGNNSSS